MGAVDAGAVAGLKGDKRQKCTPFSWNTGRDTPVDGSNSVNSFEAQLPAELGSVVASRRLVEAAARTWGIATSVSEDAALAVSELVTNAVLHAGTVVHVTVRRLGRGMRLEVQDGSARLPVVGADRPEDLLAIRSMTGRGLALLAAAVDRWGADPLGTGKVMWAEPGTERRYAVPVGPEAPKVAMGSQPAMTNAAGVAAPGRSVHLIGVPVRLLVESTRQFADLQREMQVLGLDHNGPAELVALAETNREISAQIGSLRHAGSEVAQSALARGESVIDFDVVVPDNAVDAFDRLGSLIRRVGDTLFRRHLLTMPPSAEVTAYRRWYRDEIAAQLRGRPPRPCPFAAVQA
jgi:anti-sigma regulatory factor (Ser/Thr protein kinase)